MTSSLRSQIESGTVPADWMVFRRSAKRTSSAAVGYIVLGAVLALVGIWLFSDPTYAFAGLILLVFGIYLAIWRGIRTLRKAGFGAIILTETECVLLDGIKEYRYAFSEITDVRLRVDSGMANQPVPELYIATSSATHPTRLVRGREFGEPEAIRNALSAKLRS
ncbi:MAG: hypothetical protein KC925_03935 [Candidatus Doudnabacteria bacterium]|nr:hypothetical protein [Candidatus Doudnabacteria bacterium]